MRIRHLHRGGNSGPCTDSNSYNRGLASCIARRATPLVVGAGLLTGAPAQAANFSPGNVSELIANINTANTNGENDVIDLGGNTFTLTGIENTTDGNNGLPSIVENGFTLTLTNGTLRRDAGAPPLRLLHVAARGALNLVDTTVSGGALSGFSYAGGAGLLNRGALSLSNSVVSGNSTVLFGGGIYNAANATLTLTDSTVSGNSASAGGGLFNRSATVNVTGSTVSGNSAQTGGGMSNDVATVTISNSVISGNSANNAGGISNSNGSTTLTNSTVSGNVAAYDGGGLANADNAIVTVIGSTISGNTAGNSAANMGLGGGIHDQSSATTTLTNSTVSGNSAGRQGSGIHASANAATHLINSTVSGNLVGYSGSAVYADRGAAAPGDEGTVTLANSLVVNTIGANGYNCGVGGDYVQGSGVNFSDDNSCAGATFSAAAGNLEPLADNGGPTQTHLPQSGNPAIDGADQTVCDANGVDTDQRGVARPLDADAGTQAICDVGAVEVQPRGPIVVAAGVVDPSDGDGQCSLPEAIANANDDVDGQPFADCSAGNLLGRDVITLPAASRFTFASAGDTTDGANALPSIQSWIEFEGNGAIVERDAASGQAFRLLHVAQTGRLALQDAKLYGGRAEGNGLEGRGGGLLNRGRLDLTNSNITSSYADFQGGGVFHDNAMASVVNSSLSGNVAGQGGGAMSLSDSSVTLLNSTIADNTALYGGGLVNNGSSGLLELTASTVSGNSVVDNGGGLAAQGNSTTRLTNSTVSGNTAYSGGGLVVFGADIELAHSTLFGNSANNQGGLFTFNAGTEITQSLVAGNVGGNCGIYSGTTSTTGNNLADDASCSGFINDAAAADLDPLADNGGPTRTHRPRPANPAVDGGDQAVCDANTINTDQRAIARPLDGDGDGNATCDIGAVEIIGPIAVDAGVVDPTDGDGQCSLIEAIGNANDTNGGRPFMDCSQANPHGPDTITLPSASSFTFTSASDYSNGANALPSVTSDITIAGNGATLARDPASGNNFRLIHVAASGTLSVTDATLTGGYASLAADSGDKGGAIANRGNLRLTRSTLSANSAVEDGGALWNDGTLQIIDSTLSGNSAVRGGGGIYSQASAEIRNSTLSGNASAEGGGISNRGGTLDLTHSTLADNTASMQGGGIHNAYATFTSANTLIANNSLDNCSNYSSTVNTQGINLASDASCTGFASDPAAGDLNPLADNGGPTQTHLPQATNPAIDGGDQTFCNVGGINTDQRGLVRPQDGDGDSATTCDVGAVEALFAGPIPVDAGVVAPIDGDNQCSLVEAIVNANDTENLGQPNADCARGNYQGADTLILPNGARFTFASANDMSYGANALPSITSQITIEGNNAIIERDTGSGDAFRLIHIAPGGSLALQDAEISGGRANGFGVQGFGAGILNLGSLTLSGTTVSGNTAQGNGGGIAHSAASASISNSRITGNAANTGGGMYIADSIVSVAESTVSGNTATGFFGGGFANSGNASTLSLVNSTISGNASGGYGGGIGATSSTNNLTNTTVSANTATNSGGGIQAFSATLHLTHSTIFGNSANTAGGFSTYGTHTEVGQSLFAANTGGNCGITGGGSFNSVGMNLADDASCPGFTNTPAAADMAPLADNGGPTQTHLLLASNPAVDAFDCTVPVTDQRGITRPQDGNVDQQALCDAGAVELEADNTDSDMDGIADAYEQAFGLNAGVDDSGGDLDGDGLLNIDEFNNGAQANNPDTDDDGLGDAIDADVATASNACVQDGMGDADFNFTAMTGMITQCAAENSITVLDAANAVIEIGAILQLYSLSVSFDTGASVPMGAAVQTIIGDPSPGAPP